MKNLTVFCTERKAVLNFNINLFEGDECDYEPVASFEEGETVFVIASYTHEDYASGKAYVISDGKETTSVDSSLIALIN